MSLEIKKWPDPYLIQPTVPLTPNDIKSQKVQDLIELMWKYVFMNRYEIWGITANQAGYLYRIAVLSLSDRIQEIINPGYSFLSKEKDLSLEQCRSLLPFVIVPVTRSRFVTIEGFNRYGEEIILSAAKREAAVFQHEMDHLEGVLTPNWRKRAKFLASLSLEGNQSSRLGNHALI